MEKDQTIASMQQKIEELKQKAEQGSQQLQGEVQELELESPLRAKFLFDSVEPVPKGEFGGDALHRVVSPSGQTSGTILWESKRTKNWSDGWLAKLREDQRTAKADLSVLVSQALPKGGETFDVIDGVWVTHPRAALPVGTVLRHNRAYPLPMCGADCAIGLDSTKEASMRRPNRSTLGNHCDKLTVSLTDFPV